ncbi:MAG TPA: discoidin domain-containing protein [Acidobacteriaceae bacterium]|nr:discoidin domain-containing protein [Acidobacteriaceae bacterium]
MRKTPISASPGEQRSALDAWLDIEDLAAAEISSEDPAHPFEAALRGDNPGGWRAAKPGPQTIRIKFDKPTAIRRIRLEFREAKQARSQEFRLSAKTTSGEEREIARQQWNFSPNGSTIEVEDYSVQLRDIAEVELAIDPGRHDQQQFATLQSISIA